jgi:basic amino acid/polyamine antiporter, APA family
MARGSFPHMPLKRELGLPAAIAMVTGESIALGIFLTPAAMAKSLGSPALLAAVWFAMALMACAGALCYSQLTITLPEAGGGYVYLRRFYGERLAFLYGWMSLTVMDSGLSAALAVGASAYIATLVPAVAPWPRLTAAALLMAIAAINYRGTRISGRFMAAVNLLKLAVIATLIVWAFASRSGSVENLLPLTTRRPGSDALILGIAGAFINAFFSYGGWWDVTKLAGEVRDPQRNLPRALILGVLAVTFVYVGLSAAFLYVVPLQQVASNNAFVAQFGEALFGRLGSAVLTVCVLISVVGGLTALMMAAPRVYYAMSLDGNLFPQFAKLHPRYGSPANAILLQLLIALGLLGLGAFDKIISYVIFSAVIFLAITAAAVFRLPEARSAKWYPGAPLLFILCCAVVGAMILMRDPLQALLGVLVVAIGYPLHWRRHRVKGGELQAAIND